jgi:membrane associated rhomboid family serine protease
VIPIADDAPTRRPAFLNWLLIAVCTLVFVWEWSLGRAMNAAIAILGFTPAAFFHPHAEVGLPGYITVPGWATIFTAMFLHGGILHIAGNMLYLWIFGRHIEDAMGHFRYLIFYLASGVVAALTFAYMDPASHAPMIGASGAISGVLAAYVLLFPRARVTVIVPLGIIFYPFTISAVWVIGFWFILQLISVLMNEGAHTDIAWWAHIGGFIFGLLATPLFKTQQFRLFGRHRAGPWG